jgi:hypothetical protein
MTDDWTAAAPPTWHVSRRIPASLPEATRALGDALRVDPLLLSLGPGFTIDRVAHLRLDEARRFSGRLQLGVAGTTRVDVEIEAWSHTESALAVRPRRRAPRARAARYFAHAVDLLVALEACVMERIVTPAPIEVRRAS